MYILNAFFFRAVFSHSFGENRLVGSKQDVVEELQVCSKSDSPIA